MKCNEVKENLDALLDGEAAIFQTEKIENHLENCFSCQTEFKNLQMLSRTLKQNLPVSAPAFLDEKIFSEFENFHAAKRAEKPQEKSSKEKIGWFGIPRFAFAAALVLFTLATISAFQIGRMSASEISLVMPEVQENTAVKQDEKSMPVKIVEVPVIREKIVEVPVIKEKIVTKKIYINQENAVENEDKSKVSTALNEMKANNEYLTPIELKGFQPVAKIKARITKKSEVNENYE